MKNIKTFLFLGVVFSTTTAFAAWSQPTATPPAGNTQPPINIGSMLQYKKGTIGAYKFCLYDISGNSDSCLGGNDTTNVFPWIYDGNTGNIKNTNNGVIQVSKPSSAGSGLDFIREFNVLGGISSDELCLGSHPVIPGAKNNGSCITSWSDVGGAGDVLAGTSKTNKKITLWQSANTKTIADSILSQETVSGVEKLVLGGEKITKWSDIPGIKGDAGAGGIDGIAGSDGYIISCSIGKILKSNGTKWVCADASSASGDVVAGPLKTNNYLTKWIDATTNKIANSVLYEEAGKICLGTGASKSCITNWSDIKNGVSKIIAGTNVTITSTGTGGTGEVTVNSTATGGGDIGPGTTNKISKFTASNKIGDSNISDNGIVVEVSAIPLKAINGLIIPKVNTDNNSLEEGAIWLNTSVVVP